MFGGNIQKNSIYEIRQSPEILGTIFMGKNKFQ
jgi:hypothetical protein